ncbi:hypothetical protein AWC38_SpisGene23285 [Stylophora pistillata]|uniref:Uncharacterized protein n=1 Tax=Stylophora pistillata TaxID=50429 RepID=A0A2B4R4Z7_STYPI|nr:hypothetical protein AWC38_SpisGene23285 [Stylophora pistillata]
MAQRELEWKLECQKRELDLLRRKREDEMAVISAQNQAEVAHLEPEILGQEFNRGKASYDEIFKLNPGLLRDTFSKNSKEMFIQSHLGIEKLSHEYSPLRAISKPLPVKNLEFHAAHGNSLTLGSTQVPVAQASESDIVTLSTAVQSPQRGLYRPERQYSSQTTATPVSLALRPPSCRDLSSPGYVTTSQPKPGSFDNRVLMRFRTGRIGIVADIEQIFHQVRVCEEDRDSLLFLWRDLDETKRPNEYKMTVHVLDAVDSPCCTNYALQRTACDQQGKFSKDAINAVRRNFYLDDLLASKQNCDEATGLAKDLIGILATGGFQLKKWMSNSREVLTAIPLSEVVGDIVHLDCNGLP